MPYCGVEDLLIGDIPLPSKHGNGSRMIQSTADEIDAQIGHIYVTPVVIDDQPQNRPAKLLLKKINFSLASGRLILDMAIAGEDHSLQAYGKYLINDALNMLAKIVDGTIVLTGAEVITGQDAYGKVSIINEDSESLVQSFYNRYSGDRLFNFPPQPPIRPYR